MNDWSYNCFAKALADAIANAATSQESSNTNANATLEKSGDIVSGPGQRRSGPVQIVAMVVMCVAKHSFNHLEHEVLLKGSKSFINLG